MKVHIKFIPLVIITLFFLSCNSKKEADSADIKTIDNELVAEDIQQVKVDIKGMTCEIGCARLIQSKLYKADGVTYAEVSFADSSGIVRFDQNRISQQEIKQVIEKTAGGDIYSVVSIKSIEPVLNSNEVQ